MRFLGRSFLPDIRSGRSPPCALGGRDLGELVGVEEVADGNWLVAAGAQRTGAQPAAPRVAVVASLLAEVAGVADGAGVDGVGAGDDWLDRGAAGAPPAGLAAASGAEPLASLGLERLATHEAGDRRAIVAHGVHAAASDWSLRSTRTPLRNTAPARTRDTRWGALTARQRLWADSISL